MKKILVLLLTVCLVLATFGIGASAASQSVTKSYKLSNTDKTVSGYTYKYDSGDASVTTYVQHWKGNLLNADTARTQIKYQTNLKNSNCVVKLYASSTLSASYTDETYAETAGKLWQDITRTYHQITTTANSGDTFKYVANGEE